MNIHIKHIKHQRDTIFAMTEIHTTTRVDESDDEQTTEPIGTTTRSTE
jgi:hypothetical protein